MEGILEVIQLTDLYLPGGLVKGERMCNCPGTARRSSWYGMFVSKWTSRNLLHSPLRHSIHFILNYLYSVRLQKELIYKPDLFLH